MTQFNCSVIELTGDVTPDTAAIQAAAVIITTPEKWDGISRHWASREYVRRVALLVVDEIHLLGVDRGPVLEVSVGSMPGSDGMEGHEIAARTCSLPARSFFC